MIGLTRFVDRIRRFSSFRRRRIRQTVGQSSLLAECWGPTYFIVGNSADTSATSISAFVHYCFHRLTFGQSLNWPANAKTASYSWSNRPPLVTIICHPMDEFPMFVYEMPPRHSYRWMTQTVTPVFGWTDSDAYLFPANRLTIFAAVIIGHGLCVPYCFDRRYWKAAALAASPQSIDHCLNFGSYLTFLYQMILNSRNVK